MKNVNLEKNELTITAIFQQHTKEETIQTLKEALEILEQEESDPENEEMIEIINSTVGKLQQIEDQYYYSLDLNYYLNNLDAYGKMVVEECKKFDEKTKQKIHDYIQQQVPLNPVEQLKQNGKIRLEHYQKFYQNGTYERSRESGTEANYDMEDGLANNQKKNSEKISDACSNKQTSQNQQDNKPKKGRSVIK